jgi:hypothetical protein
VFKKAQDLQEQQGQAILQLINDSAVPAQSIDVRV